MACTIERPPPVFNDNLIEIVLPADEVRGSINSCILFEKLIFEQPRVEVTLKLTMVNS